MVDIMFDNIIDKNSGLLIIHHYYVKLYQNIFADEGTGNLHYSKTIFSSLIKNLFTMKTESLTIKA